MSLVHMLFTALLFAAGPLAMAGSGLAVFAGMDVDTALLVGFALSFSSTVFAVKALEPRGEMGALHGQIAIGILVVQDIAAVVFLALSSAKLPSAWALLLLLLLPLRPVLTTLLHRIGRGELQILFGFLLALGGAEVFELVSLKGDLGALALGCSSRPTPGRKSWQSACSASRTCSWSRSSCRSDSPAV